MEYNKRSINGDAGEYLLAYKMIKILGWPCRLYGIDLGVDAEIEIMDENSHSTGNLIKIQVKAVQKIQHNDSVSIYVDDRHIEYWRTFCLPVIVCCIDLETENVYWKQITCTEAYRSNGTSRKVTFDLKSDLLTENSLAELSKLISPDNTEEINGTIQEIFSIATNLPKAPYTISPDHQSIDYYRSLARKVLDKTFHVESLVNNIPWRLSVMEHNNLALLKNEVSLLQREINIVHTDIVNGG